MLKRRLYYILKPYIPWGLRMSLRKASARRVRAEHQDVWPINPSAGRKPEGWTGWPDNKQFAFVLTHDVEGPGGLAKCRQLAEVEQQYGFRSSFNFVPEGTYTVPAELRQWLTGQGFEVGVHDLQHDGRLFTSRRSFAQKAIRINRYIRDWGAQGFRTGFMLRQLEWMHDLDVRYDASTFDTDPFELQADGAGTIFPYWVPAGEGGAERFAGRNRILASRFGISSAPYGEVTPGRELRDGYLELPYTLVQDSTLYTVLGETSPRIWLQKLDWIAQQGGMALLNLHPDYVQFPGEPAGPKTYPLSHYVELLQYLRNRYQGKFWEGLPKELAEDVRNRQPASALRRKRRVCMVTHSFYEVDNRVTRYAESLAARGDDVDVFALRRGPDVAKAQTIEGVNVFRIQDRFSKSQSSKLAYLWPIVRFLGASAMAVTRHSKKQRYDLLHVHNMPDFLVYAGLYPKLSGARIILDIHDIVPEFYGSKFKTGKGATVIQTLKWLERKSAQFADYVIVSNDLWKETFTARTGTSGKCSVFINNVDNRVFQPTLRTRQDDRVIVIFPGGLQWHQGLDLALRAFTRVSQEIPQAEFHIYGDGIMKPSLISLAKELGFNGKVKFFEPIRIKEIAQVMANSDLGVVPKRADSFGNEAYSTKIMEFMSVGVPVVVSRTKIDQFYFNDSVVRFFTSGDIEALADGMLDVLRNRQLRDKLVTNALEYSDRNSWKSRKNDYLSIVDRLVTDADVARAN